MECRKGRGHTRVVPLDLLHYSCFNVIIESPPLLSSFEQNAQALIAGSNGSLIVAGNAGVKVTLPFDGLINCELCRPIVKFLIVCVCRSWTTRSEMSSTPSMAIPIP